MRSPMPTACSWSSCPTAVITAIAFSVAVYSSARGGPPGAPTAQAAQVASTIAAFQPVQGGSTRWTSPYRPAVPCVGPHFRARHVPTSPSGGIQAAALAPLIAYRAFGGNPYEDLFPGIFVDTDPTVGGYSDFHCSALTYDGHGGHDIGLRSFGEQVIGVPVFSVAAGTVVFVKDGFPDMNTQPGIDDGNYISIDHGGGQVAWYFHLKKGSVAVTVGQNVVAGQQIGAIGSSGYSYGPHLHFEVQQGGIPFEPMAGPCSQPQSLFSDQPPLKLDTYAFDFGVTTEDLFQSAGFPTEQPKQAQIPLNAGFLYFWMQIGNIPPGATWRVRFLRPNGTVAQDSLAQPWGNTTFERYWPGFFYWWVPDVQTTAGTWRYVFDFNGVTVIDAPFDVVANPIPGFNRPPEPITASFDPPEPAPDAPVFARVSGSLITDDLDWDLVRYRYEWSVNGQVVRDVVTAGRADAIAAGVAPAGSILTCKITPRDPTSAGPSVQLQASVEANAWITTAGGTYGTAGVPRLVASGTLAGNSMGSLGLGQAGPGTISLLFLALNASALPLLGGTFVPAPVLAQIAIPNGPTGSFSLPFTFPPGVPTGVTIALQAWMQDPAGPLGVSSTNSVVGTTP